MDDEGEREEEEGGGRGKLSRGLRIIGGNGSGWRRRVRREGNGGGRRGEGLGIYTLLPFGE